MMTDATTTTDPTTDSTKLDKIRALLAQAEGTPYPEEARTFYDAAQRLMTKYAIDEMMLRDAAPVGTRPTPTSKVVVIGKPNIRLKGRLLTSVALRNGCKVVGLTSTAGMQRAPYTIVGYESRIQATETLYTSLLTQCVKELLATTKPAGVHGKTWTANFYDGFSLEIGERLRRVTVEVEQSVGNALVPLRNEKADVEEKLGEMYPNLRKSYVQPRASDIGWREGRQAGSRANIGREMSGTRRGLGKG